MPKLFMLILYGPVTLAIYLLVKHGWYTFRDHKAEKALLLPAAESALPQLPVAPALKMLPDLPVDNPVVPTSVETGSASAVPSVPVDLPAEDSYWEALRDSDDIDYQFTAPDMSSEDVQAQLRALIDFSEQDRYAVEEVSLGSSDDLAFADGDVDYRSEFLNAETGYYQVAMPEDVY